MRLRAHVLPGRFLPRLGPLRREAERPLFVRAGGAPFDPSLRDLATTLGPAADRAIALLPEMGRDDRPNGDQPVGADRTPSEPMARSSGGDMAESDLLLPPLVMAEPQRAPAETRIGLVVREGDTGLPWRRRRFARAFRQTARAAGVPDTVWDIGTRSGTATGAYAKGLEGMMP